MLFLSNILPGHVPCWDLWPFTEPLWDSAGVLSWPGQHRRGYHCSQCPPDGGQLPRETPSNGRSLSPSLCPSDGSKQQPRGGGCSTGYVPHSSIWIQEWKFCAYYMRLPFSFVQAVLLWCAKPRSLAKMCLKICLSLGAKTSACLSFTASTGSGSWWETTKPPPQAHSKILMLKNWEWDWETMYRLQCCCISLVQVCAFAHEADPDMKGKILIRLTNITEMQNQFETCMNGG